MAILAERDRQDKLFPEQVKNPPSDLEMNSVLGEEVGEVCKALNEHDPENLEEELIQVAAVCVKWLERIYSARRVADSDLQT